MSLPELYTPEQAAQTLRISSNMVLKLCRAKKIGCHKLSQKTILISPKHIQEYLEDTECPKETKESTLPKDEIADGGESLNTETETDIGLMAATIAEKKLMQHLSSSKSQNVVKISRLGK